MCEVLSQWSKTRWGRVGPGGGAIIKFNADAWARKHQMKNFELCKTFWPLDTSWKGQILGYLQHLPNLAKISCSHHPGFNYLVLSFLEVKGKFHSCLDYFIIKGCNSGMTSWERCPELGMGTTSLQHPHTRSALGVPEGFATKAWLVIALAIDDNWPLVTVFFSSSITMEQSPAWLASFQLGHILSQININILEWLSPCSCSPKTEDKAYSLLGQLPWDNTEDPKYLSSHKLILLSFWRFQTL